MRLLKIPIVIFFIYLFCAFKNNKLTWIAIGDSITYLNDHPEETGNRITKGYLTGVTEKFTNLRYLNKGTNGATSGWIAAHIDSLGLTKADLYTVFLGTNDWWQGRPVGNLSDYKADAGNVSVYGSFRIIINKIRALNPRAKVVLITPMQRADFVYVNDARNYAYGSYKAKNGQFLAAFASAVMEVGKYEHFPVIDLYHNARLKAKDLINFKQLKDSVTGAYVNYRYPQSSLLRFNPQTDEYPYPKDAVNLTYDGLHPSDKGNAIIAKLVAATFKKTDAQLDPRENK